MYEQITVYIPLDETRKSPLHDALKAQAQKEGMTISQFIRHALNQYLIRVKAEGKFNG